MKIKIFSSEAIRRFFLNFYKIESQNYSDDDFFRYILKTYNKEEEYIKFHKHVIENYGNADEFMHQKNVVIYNMSLDMMSNYKYCVFAFLNLNSVLPQFKEKAANLFYKLKQSGLLNDFYDVVKNNEELSVALSKFYYHFKNDYVFEPHVLLKTKINFLNEKLTNTFLIHTILNNDSKIKRFLLDNYEKLMEVESNFTVENKNIGDLFNPQQIQEIQRSKNLLNVHFIDKYHISIDLKKANYQVLNLLGVIKEECFFDFALKYTTDKYIYENKMFREVFFGALSGRIQDYQKPIMSEVCRFLYNTTDEFNIFEPSNDEIVLVFNNSTPISSKIIDITLFNYLDYDFNITDYFLKSLNTNRGNFFYKHYFNGVKELKGVHSVYSLQAHKLLNNLKIEKEDLRFEFKEMKCMCYMDNNYKLKII